ncbi:MAG: DNA-binding response regulator [Chloroflexi bacterium]|nr:MAG: DNA-binding response regulator [Chloroflexota bacterium]
MPHKQAIILLIEGKSAGNLSLVPALEKAGYHLKVVHTAKAALEWCLRLTPDLIVFDASSMRSNGVRSCRRLRQLLGKGVPIIHTRAEGDVADMEAGADVYLERPFTARKLLNRIRILLPVDDTDEEIIQLGDLIFYRTKRTVEVRGMGEKRLTPKLAFLLEEFIRHPCQIITRRQLMQNVWKTDYVGDTRTLDVHIRWIRECIEKNPARPKLLRTVRGKGYILSIPVTVEK